MFGQMYFSFVIFDFFCFVGFILVSDECMLLFFFQGYVLKISGIVNSNVQVIVSQNGCILYQIWVLLGFFEFFDLSQNISGNLDVSVWESDGSVWIWQVNMVSVFFMVCQGQVCYKVVVGCLLYGGMYNNSMVSFDFLFGEVIWGVFNNMLLYGGFIVFIGDYQFVVFGIGQNMGLLGVLFVDVICLDVWLLYGQKQFGYSYCINYVKMFDKIGSILVFVGYCFLDCYFLFMLEYLQCWIIDGGDVWYEKQSYIVIYSQFVLVFNMSVVFLVSWFNYWNVQFNNNYMFSFNKVFSFGDFQGFLVLVLFVCNQYIGGGSQNQVYVIISILWGDSCQVSYSVQKDNWGGLQQIVNYSDFYNLDIIWNISVGYNCYDIGSNSSFSGSVQSCLLWG